MAGGVLVDSSAWIEYLGRKTSPISALVDRLLEEDRAFIVPPIFAEVVSGARSRREFERLFSAMSALSHPAEPADLWGRIADARFKLNRKGTRAAIVDLWIAVAASFSGLPLLTLDSDFDRIGVALPIELVAIP
ncbi:MAG: PIN domain-containing protein [Planctomycetota bacterium]|jgi:predicted nucleic acid-binding protein